MLRPENMIREAHNFILIIPPREKALLGGVVKSFPSAALHAHDGLRRAHFLVRLERHVTQKDAHVLPLQHAIVVEIIPYT